MEELMTGEICCSYNMSGSECKSSLQLKYVALTICQELMEELVTGEICCSYNKSGSICKSSLQLKYVALTISQELNGRAHDR